MTEQEVARKLLAYKAALEVRYAEKSVLDQKILDIQTGIEKLEKGLIKKLEKKQTEVIVGLDRFTLAKTPGKIVIKDEKRVPKWAKKTTTKTVNDIAKIKARYKKGELEGEDWFTYEQENTLRYAHLEEDEE